MFDVRLTLLTVPASERSLLNTTVGHTGVSPAYASLSYVLLINGIPEGVALTIV